MRILLLGKNGQLGWELQRALAVLGDVIALDRQGRNGWCGDLGNLDGLRATVRDIRPHVIVNAAAWTQVDLTESHPEDARLINALAPQVLAEEQAKSGGWLVHYSTDYVFDGSGSTPWRETDVPNPINEYGRSKLAGEQAIEASGCRHLIFRTSWVYGAHGNNFLKTMLALGQARTELSVVNDQIGAPTSADLLADVTTHGIRTVLANPGKSGLYHLVAAGETSRYGYAQFIFDYVRRREQRGFGWGLGRGSCDSRHELDQRDASKLAVETLNAISSAQWATPALRPLNSRLDIGKLQDTFALQMPDWQTGVSRLLDEMLDAMKW